MLTAFKYGLTTGIRLWRPAVIVYILQWSLAFTVGMQVYDVLEASIGHSLELNKLLTHYDHTVITDFLKVHGASITPLIGQLRWLILAWLLFSVFIDGGLLYCAQRPDQAGWKAFWQGGAAHFFPFFRIAMFFLAAALGWSLLLWGPVLPFIEPSVQVFPSEKYTVGMILAVLALWLFGLALLLLWSLLSRLESMENGLGARRSIRAGARRLRNRFRGFLGLMALFTGLQLLLAGLYNLLECNTGMVTPVLIGMVFLLQQGYVFLRIQLRIMLYAAVSKGLQKAG